MLRTPTLCFLLVLSSSVAAGHHEAAENEAPGALDPDAMMEAAAAAMTPGAEHAHLADSVGAYNAAMKFWMAPGEPALTSSMSVQREMDLGGRVLTERWRGMAFGQPFEGVGRTGYDNVNKRYWSTWTDTFSTGVLVMYGTVSADGQTLEFTGTGTNPATGESYKTRSVGSLPGAAVETMTMYEDHGEGEYKSMSVTLTPKAAP
ncbi:MAG: DUF1579 family protein [Pseudomonadota bacterium]